MIKLTDINGATVYMAPRNIAMVTEAGTSSKWHGINAIVQTFDGRTIECQQSSLWIAEQIVGDDNE